MVGTAPLVQARASRYVNRVGWEQARYHKGQGILPSTWQSREAPPHMCPLPVCASVCVRACLCDDIVKYMAGKEKESPFPLLWSHSILQIVLEFVM